MKTAKFFLLISWLIEFLFARMLLARHRHSRWARSLNEVGVLESPHIVAAGLLFPQTNSHIFFQKVRFLKIRFLFVSLSVALFHRETTLRTPRELPETANLKKVRFVKIRAFTLKLLTLFSLKICRSANFVVPLQIEIYKQ